MFCDGYEKMALGKGKSLIELISSDKCPVRSGDPISPKPRLPILATIWLNHRTKEQLLNATDKMVAEDIIE